MPKMNKKWIALCTAAIGAIYAAEYMATDAQAFAPRLTGQAIAEAGIPTHNSPSINMPSTSASSDPFASDLNSNIPPSSNPEPSAKKKTYTDGTYAGMGSNRRGYIEVAVTISSDQITDVEINKFGMHYSEKDVEGLPDEVLQIQSAKVDNVSGATYSTEAFHDAVNDALSQAKND